MGNWKKRKDGKTTRGPHGLKVQGVEVKNRKALFKNHKFQAAEDTKITQVIDASPFPRSKAFLFA